MAGKLVQLDMLSINGKMQRLLTVATLNNASLIRFNNNHISAAELTTADDILLEAFIHNKREPPIPEICGYLQEVGFLHVSRMQGGCKLNPTLISALVERWRLETHTFHLPCSEYTITLKMYHHSSVYRWMSQSSQDQRWFEREWTSTWECWGRF
ncbi:hypothetical protein PVK06_042646 [Gossypium arboreum]|uniref:Aminotransferase-like plant mobile domain-containing protein n=1 Tax=Gossypium arboreum TaxID=29729 RepID=A0ABR0MLJ1_GOSAR|nr:hypothetical protein PVK06_042646 [Gossypium arboreum]